MQVASQRDISAVGRARAGSEEFRIVGCLAQVEPESQRQRQPVLDDLIGGIDLDRIDCEAALEFRYGRDRAIAHRPAKAEAPVQIVDGRSQAVWRAGKDIQFLNSSMKDGFPAAAESDASARQGESAVFQHHVAAQEIPGVFFAVIVSSRQAECCAPLRIDRNRLIDYLVAEIHIKALPHEGCAGRIVVGSIRVR